VRGTRGLPGRPDAFCRVGSASGRLKNGASGSVARAKPRIDKDGRRGSKGICPYEPANRRRISLLFSQRCESISIEEHKSSSHNARHHFHNLAIALMLHRLFPRCFASFAIRRPDGLAFESALCPI